MASGPLPSWQINGETMADLIFLDSKITADDDCSHEITGVGCHFLLQCMKVKSESEAAQSCPTLRDPMDCSPPGSSAYGIFQARVLDWGAMPSP